MKVAFDSSVLVAAMVSTHRDHARAVVWLDAVSTGAVQGVVSVHAPGELWSVLTKLPVSPPISPKKAREAVDEVLTRFATEPLLVQIYRARLSVAESPPIVVPPDPPAIRFQESCGARRRRRVPALLADHISALRLRLPRICRRRVARHSGLLRVPRPLPARRAPRTALRRTLTRIRRWRPGLRRGHPRGRSRLPRVRRGLWRS